MNKKIEIILLIIIVAIGTWMRFWGTQDMSFNVDEAISTNAAFNILKQGKPYVYEGSKNIYNRDPLHTYAIALGIKLFGNSEGAARLPFVFCGALSIIGTFWLAKIISKKYLVALISALAIAFSVWAITTSHMARMYELYRMLAVFEFIWIYYFITADGSRKKKYFFGALMILFAVLAYETHRSALLFLPIIACVFAYGKRDYILKHKNKFIIFAALVVVECLAIVLNLEDVPILRLSAHDLNSFTSMKITAIPWQFILINYPLWFFGFWFLGLGSKIKSQEKFFFWLVVASLFIIDLLVYSSVPSYRTQYFQFAVPAFFALATWGIYEFYEKYPYKRTIIAIIILFLLSLKGFVINPSVSYKGLPDIKAARDAITLQGNDIIIGHPVATVYYYFGNVDYWLVNNKAEIKNYSQEGVDYYGGARILQDLDELDKIISNNHGYVVIEEARWRFIDKRIKGYIENNTEKIEKVNSEYLYVSKF